RADAGCPRCPPVRDHGGGQPDAIVGDASADPPARRRVPPVLDVALDELPGGGSAQVVACDVAPGDGERHHVLELIAEAVGAAGLIEGRAGPDAAGERLVEEPPVEG